MFHPWRVGFSVITGVLLGVGVFYAFQVQTALVGMAVDDFDPDSARRAIEAAHPGSSNWVFTEPSNLPGDEESSGPHTELAAMFDLTEGVDPHTFNPHAFGASIDDDVFTSYLMVGTDASRQRADVIIFALDPADGGDPILVSLPRDLYVWNVCKGSFARLNAALGGCTGIASGTELLAILVEDFTGISVDHSARVDFSGFSRIVNAMGGTTICVDYPTRDVKSKLDITEPGCRHADGATTLAWVRSRHPEQLRGGEWVQVAGSDYTRQIHQQDVLFQLADRAANFSSPASLTDRLSAVVAAVRLDDSWTFGQAVATAWRYRGISKDSVLGFSIDADSYRTPGGAAVLLPTRSFAEQLEGVYPLD